MTERLPDPSLPYPINRRGVLLLADREKCRNAAYLDWPGRNPTIGWGETKNVKLGMVWTNEECDQDLLNELIVYTDAVRGMCKVPPSSNQLAGLVVCAWNIGIEGMRRSSMMRLHNAGDFAGAARAFAKWVYATQPDGKKVVVDELVSRRAAEAALYLQPDDDAPQYPTPQIVAEERPLSASPTMAAGGSATVIGGATLVLSSIKDFGTQASDFAKSIAADLGLSPVQALAGIVVIIGLVVAYRRWLQHRDGVA